MQGLISGLNVDRNDYYSNDISSGYSAYNYADIHKDENVLRDQTIEEFPDNQIKEKQAGGAAGNLPILLFAIVLGAAGVGGLLTIQLQSSLTSYRTEVDNLTKRIISLESASSTTSSTTTTSPAVTAAVTALQTDVTALKAKAISLMTMVSDGATAITALQTSVLALETKTMSLMASVTNGDAAVTALTGTVAALDTKAMNLMTSLTATCSKVAEITALTLPTSGADDIANTVAYVANLIAVADPTC